MRLAWVVAMMDLQPTVDFSGFIRWNRMMKLIIWMFTMWKFDKADLRCTTFATETLPQSLDQNQGIQTPNFVSKAISLLQSVPN